MTPTLLKRPKCLLVFSIKDNTSFFTFCQVQINFFNFGSFPLYNFQKICYTFFMKKVVIYTDGACSYNPGPGGWGAILFYGNLRKEISGGANETTNNQMELTAVIEALSALKEPCEVEVFTDSAYVCNAFKQDWISSWLLNNWRNSNKKPVANKELWEKLIELCRKHKVNFNKVKGHADNEFNNRCDELARLEVEKILTEKNS